jgi:DNA polymerase-1
MGFDYETNLVKRFIDRRPRTLQFGDKNEQYIIDWLAFAETKERLTKGLKWGKPAPWAKPVIEVLAPFLESNKILKVGTSLQFEYSVSRFNLGLFIWHLYDISLVEKIRWAGIKHLKSDDVSRLDDIVAHHFGVRVDKSLQQSFDLETPLTENQIIYAAMDTRLPLAVKAKQAKDVEESKLGATVLIENDAIGAFTDIHLHGLKVSEERWLAIFDRKYAEHTKNIAKLDEFFLPIVGKKGIPNVDLVGLENAWRDYGVAGTEEKLAKGEDREALRKDRCAKRDAAREAFYAARRAVKDAEKVLPDCVGEASINYDSNAQLRAAMLKMKGFNEKNLPNTNDDTLKKLAGKPVVDSIRTFRKTQKVLSTYGQSWVVKYTTEAGNEQGWVCPETGRIHAKVDQLEAETGRTASTQPNVQNLPKEDEVRACFVADPPDEEEPEGYVIVTADMSGAELRIIADYSGAKTWVDAFNKGWDVHSVSTEVLYPEKWPAEAIQEGQLSPDGKPLTPCAYFTKDHQKCKCPLHKELRDDTKAVNFLLCYGGGARTLAENIDCTEERASELMGIHEQKFPDVWGWLDQAGKKAVQNMEARTMFGRRRLFERPTWDKAKERAKERLKEKKIDREPSTREISSALKGMYSSIERKGKNHPIQGTNADIIKRAMGCGFDKDGKPYLWHIFPTLKAKILNMVHDELVVQCPKRFGEQVKEAIGDAYARAAAEVMKKVRMDYEGHVSDRWKK